MKKCFIYFILIGMLLNFVGCKETVSESGNGNGEKPANALYSIDESCLNGWDEGYVKYDENGNLLPYCLLMKNDSNGLNTLVLNHKDNKDVNEAFITHVDSIGNPDYLVHRQVCYTLVDSLGSTWLVGYDSKLNLTCEIKLGSTVKYIKPAKNNLTRGWDAGNTLDVIKYTKIILDNLSTAEKPSDLQSLLTDILSTGASGIIAGSMSLPLGYVLIAGEIIGWVPDALLYARGIYAFGNCEPAITNISLSDISIELSNAQTLGKGQYNAYAIIRKGENSRLDFDHWDFQSNHAAVNASKSNVQVNNPLNNSNLFNTVGKFTIRPVLSNPNALNIPIQAFRVGSYRLGGEGTFQLPQTVNLQLGQNKTATLNDNGFVDCNVDFQLTTAPTLPFKFEALLYITTAEGKVVDYEIYEVDNGNFSINWSSGIPQSTFRKDGTQDFIATVILGENKDIESEPISFSLKYKICPDENHPHAIDLGLPSGTKWACCNVGASTPEGYGGYYAWGETEDNMVYDIQAYKYYRGEDEIGMHKPFTNIGFDIAGTLYDVASVKMDAPWRMPSRTQQIELIDNCIRKYTQLNGVNGVLVTGKNGKQIFLPFTGDGKWGRHLNVGSYGLYWSSTLDPTQDGDCAYAFYVDPNTWWCGVQWRYFGIPVRAVCTE